MKPHWKDGWSRAGAVAVLPVRSVTCTLLWLACLSMADAAVFNCNAGDVACLIDAISRANANGQADTINLDSGTYSLTAAAETVDDGANGLPSITTEITIIGQGPASTVIQRDPQLGSSGAQFRIIHIAERGDLTLNSLTIKGGIDNDHNGVGVFNRGTAVITNSIIEENFTVFGSGAGIFNSGRVTVNTSIIADNTVVEGVGGAIFNDGGMTIANSTIATNSADSGGGGIFNANDMTIRNSSITDNITFLGGGGGIFANEAITTVINSTIADNTAFFGGGGVTNSGGKLSVTNGTVTRNVVDTQEVDLGIELSGGGVINTEGSVELRNTVVAGNGAVRGPDCGRALKSLGNNLIGNTTDCDVNLLSTDLTGDPGFDSFADDEAPGSGHFPLLPDSQAINAGNDRFCPSTDQLGHGRVGACDIGAIEFQPVRSGRALPVVIDIKPGRAQNIINMKSKGRISIAILSVNGFDARTVNPVTVTFGSKGASSHGKARFKDVNRDGVPDLLLNFKTQETGVSCADTVLTLTGETFDGNQIVGSDAISTVRCK